MIALVLATVFCLDAHLKDSIGNKNTDKENEEIQQNKPKIQLKDGDEDVVDLPGCYEAFKALNDDLTAAGDRSMIPIRRRKHSTIVSRKL
jgi:hypothetical protein